MGTSISDILQVTTAVQGVLPGPATNLVISSVTPTGLTLSWTAPSTGSGPFEYQAQYQLVVGDLSWHNINGLITATTIQVLGLLSNTNYQFQVLSLNSSGTTQSGLALATTSALAPSAPTALAVVGLPGPTSVTLQWSAPVSGTTPFTYQVYASLHNANSYAAVGSPVSTTSTQVTGLTQGAAYDFYVIASNNAGTGAPSPTLSNVVTASGAVAPSAPQNLRTTSIDDNDLVLAWDAPAVGTPPLSYVVQYRLHSA